VSCDACLKGNFRGRRFKCLICYDYDLCASCYESGATTTRHTTEHPMQCILTRVDYGKDPDGNVDGNLCGLLIKRSRYALYCITVWLSIHLDTCTNLKLFTNRSCVLLLSRRLVLWRRHFFSRATPVVHMSLLWQDGLHRNLPTGACHLGAFRNFHRGGEYAVHLKFYKQLQHPS